MEAIFVAFFVLILLALALSVSAAALWAIWNWLVVPAFGITFVLTFWQAFVICLLLSVVSWFFRDSK